MLISNPNPLFTDEDSKFYYLSLIKEDNNSFSFTAYTPVFTINILHIVRMFIFIRQTSTNYGRFKQALVFNTGKNADFWEHEYKKHGSCVFTDITEFEYFEKSLSLFKEASANNLPEKYYNPYTKKCLIPVSIDFKLEKISTNFEIY